MYARVSTQSADDGHRSRRTRDSQIDRSAHKTRVRDREEKQHKVAPLGVQPPVSL